MRSAEHRPGPVTAAIGNRPPFGAMERLSPERLREEQSASKGRRYSWSARGLFAVMDLRYGKDRTLPGRDDHRAGYIRHRLMPQLIAFAYYQLSWLLYALRPDWSYRLNADFEDDAEHEYALLVQEHPDWEQQAYGGSFVDDYGRYDSLADLFRQISYDERLHRLESEGQLDSPRFG